MMTEDPPRETRDLVIVTNHLTLVATDAMNVVVAEALNQVKNQDKRFTLNHDMIVVIAASTRGETTVIDVAAAEMIVAIMTTEKEATAIDAETTAEETEITDVIEITTENHICKVIIALIIK
jgi:hypothetical protein